MDVTVTSSSGVVARQVPSEMVAVRESISDLTARPLLPGVRMLVIRTRVFEGERVDVEEITRYCWRLIGRRKKALLVNDELVPHAVEFCQFKGGERSDLKRAFHEGREHGLSLVWGTQDLTDVPISAVGLSSSIWCFQTAASGLKILRRRDYLDGVPKRLIENLPDAETPAEDRGDFVRLRAGKAWDRTLYRF